MSGLLKGETLNEVRVEISWIMEAITELSDHLKLSSYSICLLRNRVQPEEAQALERVLFFSFKDLGSIPFETLRSRVAQDFESSTNKPWTMCDDLLKELLDLKIAEIRP